MGSLENKDERVVLNSMMSHILDELNNVIDSDRDETEKLNRETVLYRLYKIVDNYKELEPTLEEFFYKKARKEKFKGEEK